MRFLGPLLLIGLLGMCGCAGRAQSGQPAPTWTTGFWYWSDYGTDVSAAGGALDVLFVHVGDISAPGPLAFRGWSVYGELPRELPPAREYWLVFRFERQGVPDAQIVPRLAGEVAELLAEAPRRHLKVAGVQLDVDCPTGKLSEYASFLREVKQALPAGTQISITALLDWFRDGTAMAAVVEEVDEFVPQFYDIAERNRYADDSTIAAKIDAAQWAPRFNRFGKRFRIGISTFGRARLVPKADPQPPRTWRAVWYGDLKPLDIATNAAFDLQATRNEAGEVVLSYTANRTMRAGYNTVKLGDTVQFILSTPATVRAAVESAKKMGGQCAGVVFFRWPNPRESLAMQPSEVLIAAGLATEAQRTPVTIRQVDGGCAAVHCTDLYLVNADPLVPRPAHYRILGSTELEYFLPEDKMPIRMSGPRQLELNLPPYCGRGRMYLGRAVTAEPAQFTIAREEKR